MTINETLDKIQKDLQGIVQRITLNERTRRAEMVIDANNIVEVGKYLLKKMGFRLVIATAAQLKRDFDIYYHFSYDSLGLILNVRVTLPYENDSIDSLSLVSTAANWIEREINELYGIHFRNHPNMEKLISDGNWGKDVFPYRKEVEPKTTMS